MKLQDIRIDEQQLQEGFWRNIIAAASLVAASSHMLPDQSIDTSNAHAPTITAAPAKKVAHDEMVQKIAKRYKVDPRLIQSIAKTARKYAYHDFPTTKDILGVIGTESSFNPHAVSKLKSDPARGLMQIRPGVWGMSPSDLRTVDDQIKIGAKILRTYYEKLGSREDALHAYNVGLTNFRTHHVVNPRYVQKVNYNRSMLEELILEYDTSRIDAFMNAFKKNTTPDPGGAKNSYWYKGVFFIIRPLRYSQKVHLEEIKSPQGNGAGTAALVWFTNLADKFGIPISLHPVQLYKDGPSKEKLIDWYTRHGFESHPGTELMERMPKKTVKEDITLGNLHTGAVFYFKDMTTVSIVHPPAIYDAKAGSRATISHTEDGHVYFDLRIPGVHGDYNAYCSFDYFIKHAITKKEWDRQWMNSLKEAKHPLDLQIAKEMAMDHITEKGYIPWNADLWHEDSDVQDDQGEPYSYGEYYYGDNMDAFIRDSQADYRNYKVMDVHVPHDKPMYYNPKTEDFLIPVQFLFVDTDKLDKTGDHGMSTLDRDSRGKHGHSDDEHEMNVVTYVEVNIDRDWTRQILDLHDEIPQWNRTPEYKKLKRLAALHDDPDFMKSRFDKLKAKSETKSDRWVQITDDDKLEEAAHPLDFQIACETAREYVIDHGHEVDEEDIEYHGGFPEKFDDWIIDNVHVDIHRRLSGNPRHAEEQPAYYNEKLGAYIIPVTFDFKPSDPDESRGWYSNEATEWIMVTADGQAKKVNRYAYIQRTAFDDMIDKDDPQFAKIKKRLGAWEEIYEHDE